MKTVILGVGTILFQDEGIGVYAAKYLDENYTFFGNVTVVDGGVLGLQLMRYFQECDKVIILDTITLDDTPGSIYNLPSDELLGIGSYKQTAHEVEIVGVLESALLLDEAAEVGVIGIVPEDIATVRIGLSRSLQECFDDFISAALCELERSDIGYDKKHNVLSLESIIEQYANPTSQRHHLETIL